MASKKAYTRKVEEFDSEVIGPCHEQLEEEQELKRKNHSWPKQDFKIYPSALKSLKMCPKEFVEVKVHEPSYFSVVSLEAMEEGKVLHSEFAEIMIRIPDFVATPDLTYYGTLYPEHLETVRDKCKKAYPEAYLFDPASGIAGRIDICKQSGLIADFKSMHEPNIKYDDKKGKFITGCWETKKLDLGDGKEDHKLQVALYLYFWNLFRYSEIRFDHGMIVYINKALKNSDDKCYETPKFEFTLELERKIADLVSHLAKHRLSWIEQYEKLTDSTEYSGIDTGPCTYKACLDHGGVRA